MERIGCSGETSQQKTTSFKVDERGRFVVRAIAEVGHTFRFGSTAPWNVESTSVERRVSLPSARFFLDWVEGRMARVRRTVSDPARLRAVLEPHKRARAFWSERVRNANADRDVEGTYIGRSSTQAAVAP